MPKYRIVWSEDHLIQSMDRYRAQLSKRFWRIPIKALCFLGIAALFAVCIFAKAYLPSLLFLFFLILLLAGPRFDYWLLKRRFRRTPFYNDLALSNISESGYKSESASAKVEMPWSSFTEAHRMSDGFLLFTGPSQFHWWPDSSLESGSVTEVAEILRKFVRTYRG